MTVTYYPAKGLIGGASNDLDNIDGDNLVDLDVALTEENGVAYRHMLDADGNVAEQSPSIIVPDTTPTTKVWQHMPDSTDVRRGWCQRPKFTWTNVNTIVIGPGSYHTFDGTNHRIVYWKSDLSYTVVTNGAPDWVYIYIDESAVDTLVVNAGSALLTATQFVDAATEPAWSAAKGGWYNSSDRCIFAGYSVANDIVEFFHDGDAVFFADGIENQAAVDIDDAYTDISALIIPKFTAHGIVELTSAGGGGPNWSWRTNGQAGGTGHIVGSGIMPDVNVITDSSQVIEMIASISDAATIACTTEGWKFPVGM
ncbi:hypothetical protein LCGC14_2470540 [marine sediment metagenome]|uniref:Uncharacterized protein n=2 Tax=marine sediment metagenome TaxID=412755 RepID=A0A0F9BAF8_9ZZZZ